MVAHNTLTDPELHEPKGISSATSGSVYVANGSGSGTWTLPTPATIANPQATTSGSSFDFTSIPAGVRKINVMFRGVSTVSGPTILVQIGASTVETTGYISSVTQFNTSGLASMPASSTGFILPNVTSPDIIRAVMTLYRFENGANNWLATLQGNSGGTITTFFGAGSKSLSAPIERVRILTSDGTAFDAGNVNISWE